MPKWVIWLGLIGAFCFSGCAPPWVEPASVMNRAAPAAELAASRERLAQAKDLFYAAVAGNRDALPRSIEMLNDMGGRRSANPQVVAYFGAAELLEAARSPFFWEKAALGRDGMDLEDRAVAAAPDDLEVRFLRGVTNYQMPRFLGRFDLAQADLAYVARFAEQAANAGQLDRRAAAADLDYHGKGLEQRYDAAGAIAAWRAACRVESDSPGGRDAAKHLVEHHATP